MGFFFKRLETYTEVTPTAAMTDIITEIMVEVLTIFGIATKELRRGSASEFPIGCVSISTEVRIEKFLKKLAGRTDLEDAVRKLDRLTQEEARMALVEVLRITHSVRDEARVAAKELKSAIQQTANSVDEIKCSSCPNLAIARCSRLNLLTGNQLNQLLRTWLSPVDPSTNHNTAQKAQHKGTAVWFFQGSIFVEWKSTGSLLWIHGKRVFLSALVTPTPSDTPPVFVAGSGKSIIWFVVPCLLHFETYSSPVPPLFKTLWLYAKRDQPSWPTFTSILGISTSKPVTTCCFHSYPSFLPPLVLTVTFSTAFSLYTKVALNNPVTTL